MAKDWPETMQDMVEDGISLLAYLLAERHSKRMAHDMASETLRAEDAEFSVNAHVSGMSSTPPPFNNGTFQLRSYEQAGGHDKCGSVLFRIGDFEATWQTHINSHARQNRRVKGREWASMMAEALASLT